MEEAQMQCFTLVSGNLTKQAKKERYNFIVKTLRILYLLPIFSALVKWVVVSIKR